MLSAIAILLLSAGPLLADKSDTIKGKKPAPVTHSFTESMMAPYNIWMQNGWTRKYSVDTNLQNLEFYTTHYTLGNTGLPYVPVLLDNNQQPLGFYYGNDYISNNFYNDSTVRYYDTRAPYTRLYYVSDPQIHQFFELTHSQNVGKHFNFMVGFKRIRSEGIYLNQSTNMNQLLISAYYHSRRYSIFFDAIYNSHSFQQNGGILADTDLSSKYFTQRLTVPVNLNFATAEMLERSIHAKQYYFLGYRNGDSLKENPLFYISHSIRIAGHSNVYNDEDTADSHFYTQFPAPAYTAERHDSLTYDSLRYNEITNDISIGSSKGWNAFLRWEAGLTEQGVHFKDYVAIPQTEEGTSVLVNHQYADTVFNNYIAHARVYNAFDSGKIIFDASGQYVVEGNLQNNMQVAIQAGIKVDSLHFLKLSGAYSSQAPPFIYDLYQGNNFYWVNQLPNVYTSSVALTYWDIKWKLNITLQATQITNLAYFDTAAQPTQYHAALDIYCAGFSKNFKVYKFHLNTSEKFQFLPARFPLRLPRLVTENSIYYEGYLFKKHLLMRVGADIYFNPSYLGYAYNPETDQYFVENTASLGNYFYIDPFVSFRIKTFRMFVKYENATEGLVPYNYYYALHYPTTDATLRFGISWDFWN